jgi:hypothetical protein
MMDKLDVLFFMLLVVFLEVLHYKERRDLYSRLMAKSLSEFSAHTTEEMKASIKLEEKPKNQVYI